ncbi:MAG TPA: GGDEF domain-containing protein [Solirubrobacterales bacterium]|nr:GGDEF domain-containing protein [Solirubrobacterales bacterium]
MGKSRDTLVSIHEEARRERLLDMEERLRRYRFACFGILALALAVGGGSSLGYGYWWIALLAIGLAGFAVADRFMRNSPRPALWIAGAWAALPVLLAASVLVTGGVDSPVLVWLALPAVTLGFRFEVRGMVTGTVFVIAMLLASTVLPDPHAAWEQRQHLIDVVALIISTVILSGALIESDRAHRRRSTLDPLTGLFNRNALEQRLGELDGQPCDPSEGLSHAFLLCDLDHFKRVNDQYGHAAGDAVLQDVAYTMRAALRAGDSIYRVGGEEILVMLPGADYGEALEIAERLRKAVRERRPVGVEVSLSIGVAVAEPGRVDCEDMLARADAALYAAKAGGRDLVYIDSDEVLVGEGADTPSPGIARHAAAPLSRN